MSTVDGVEQDDDPEQSKGEDPSPETIRAAYNRLVIVLDRAIARQAADPVDVSTGTKPALVELNAGTEAAALAADRKSKSRR